MQYTLEPKLITRFANAARALVKGVDTGLFSNGIRRLDFPVEVEPGQKKIFTAVEQNPDKISGPGMLARRGHQIVQIKDNDENRLIGFFDLTDSSFNAYGAAPKPIEIDAIEKALGDDAYQVGDIKISSVGVSRRPLETGENASSVSELPTREGLQPGQPKGQPEGNPVTEMKAPTPPTEKVA